MLFTIVPLRLLASYERADGGVLTGATGERMWSFVVIEYLLMILMMKCLFFTLHQMSLRKLHIPQSICAYLILCRNR